MGQNLLQEPSPNNVMLENGADVIEGKTKDENNNDIKEQNSDYEREK